MREALSNAAESMGLKRPAWVIQSGPRHTFYLTGMFGTGTPAWTSRPDIAMRYTRKEAERLLELAPALSGAVIVTRREAVERWVKAERALIEEAEATYDPGGSVPNMR